jgi:hypothetical protein
VSHWHTAEYFFIKHYAKFICLSLKILQNILKLMLKKTLDLLKYKIAQKCLCTTLRSWRQFYKLSQNLAIHRF